MRKKTPWGWADTEHKAGPGVTFYTTPSHGGFYVEPRWNSKISSDLRNEDGWYEEDCEWAKVCLTFPDYFTADDLESAKRTLEWLLSRRCAGCLETRYDLERMIPGGPLYCKKCRETS